MQFSSVVPRQAVLITIYKEKDNTTLIRRKKTTAPIGKARNYWSLQFGLNDVLT